MYAVDMFFAGYVTRFLFTLCSYENYNCEDDDHEMQPVERQCCYLDDPCACDGSHSCPCQSYSNVHDQLTDDDNSHDGRNRHSLEHDDDGDLTVKRKSCPKLEVIYIG